MSKKVTTLFPAFGGNRTNAHFPGAILGRCEWIGVPFAGGMPEIPHLQSRSIVVNDFHLHLINAARAVRNHRPELVNALRDTMFHPDELKAAQQECRMDIPSRALINNSSWCDLDLATAYFITQWMGRSGQSSTDGEFDGNLSIRWTSSGGDSNTRYRSAVEAIEEFSKSFQRCNFCCLDFREMLSKVKDDPDHGLYCDPPWQELGDEYKHKFTEKDHRDLARGLSEYQSIKIVMRFGDHPLIRTLYSKANGWLWRGTTGRTQGNSDQGEFFISKRCS